MRTLICEFSDYRVSCRGCDNVRIVAAVLMYTRIKTRFGAAKADEKINEKFRKRKRNLMHEADQLRLCEAEIYLVVSRKKHHFTYSSTNRSGWPPSPDELVCIQSDNDILASCWPLA